MGHNHHMVRWRYEVLFRTLSETVKSLQKMPEQIIEGVDQLLEDRAVAGTVSKDYFKKTLEEALQNLSLSKLSYLSFIL